MTRGYRRIIAQLLIAVLSIYPLCASGNSEEEQQGTPYTIDDAESYIDNKQYNEAMSVLVDIVRNDPEQMERAQKLILEIKQYRDQYNQKYEELMAVLFEEEDYEKSLTLIQELESLDPNPNVATQGALTDARISAEFVYNRNVFTQIMDQALVFLNDEKYLQAINLYSTGFNLSKRTFDESNYDILIKEPAERSMNNLENLVTDLETDWAEYLRNTQNYISNEIQADTAISQEQLFTDLERLVTLREQVYQYAEIMSRQNQLVVSSSENGQEDFYLSFMERFLQGRSTQENREGILAAMDLYIDQNLNLLVDYYDEKTSTLYQNGITQSDLGNWQNAIEAYGEAYGLSQEYLSFLNLGNRRIHIDDNQEMDKHSRIVRDNYQPLIVEQQALSLKSEGLIEIGQGREFLITQIENFENGVTEDLWAERELLASLRPEYDILYIEVSNQFSELKDDPYSTELADSINSTQFFKDYQELVNGLRKLNGQILTYLSEEELDPLIASEEDFSQRLTLNQQYIEGFDQTENEQTLRVRYPQRALNDMNLLEEQYITLQENLENYLNLYRSEASNFTGLDQLDLNIQQGINLQEQVNRSLNLIRELSDQGLGFVNLAQRNLNQGDTRYNTAETALDRLNFDQAKEQLENAQGFYNEAIAYNTDILSRDELDSRITDLQARIVDEENKQVIQEVRQLINNATSDYFQGLYLRSEATLSQAENRWFTTNVEENKEIQYWMNLVRAALSVESGRDLDQMNPLYQDITKLFNLAYSNYNKGKDFLDDGDRVSAIDRLNKANQFLNQILIPLPTNQDARVLKLKIQQLLDPAAFGETFREMFRGAQQKIQSGTDLDTAYLDLKDLYSINPNYRGLANLILETEYLLGIKARPPNPADLRESAELYKNALAIYESNDVMFFESGIEQLDRAIELNPRNTDAIELKDLMAVYGTGQTTLVMSSADQLLFQQAEEKYINQEYFEAYQIVQRLLNNPENQNYSPLQELKRRIESNI